MIASGGAADRAFAMRARDAAAIGRPFSAALTVAGLSRAARARSTGLQPRRVISRCSRSESTSTLTAATHTFARRRRSAPPLRNRSSRVALSYKWQTFCVRQISVRRRLNPVVRSSALCNDRGAGLSHQNRNLVSRLDHRSCSPRHPFSEAESSGSACEPLLSQLWPSLRLTHACSHHRGHSLNRACPALSHPKLAISSHVAEGMVGSHVSSCEQDS